MPNTCVRAAAEGLPNVNRRKALALLSGGVAAAVVTPAAASLPPPSTFQDVMAACRTAEDRYAVCQARETSIAEALGNGFFPTWTAPGGASSIWSHKPMAFHTSASLEAEIDRKHAGIEASFAQGGMNKPAYDRWKRDLEEQGGKGLAALREQEAVIEASGYHDAYDKCDEAFFEAREAFRAVMVLRCETIEEVRAKAACLIRVYKGLGLELEVDGDAFVACMTSLCEEA
ncbi:MAG: hypothetical protein E5X33_10930 [Mesorhizobium sp.]|uniref:hypothetical protein n=1 Tax=Mesorhizobium sp. TaxID=1871066 RepID=UPI000FE836FD|nr:hypothetical protein [Mesorhizobium sp.]RWI95473.1 MAG: hypothetical protein EOR22_09085 [Mesorhizobium sp.]TIR21594.1 MAG: hypothetical protein E5X33_10930 [Mesorhizobium sp.]